MPPGSSAVLDDAAATGTTGSQATDDTGTGDAAVDTATQTSQQTDGTAGATDDTDPEEVSAGLISREDYDRTKDDPAAFRKAILKGFTQATQKTSAERKNLAAWSDIRDAFNEDAPTALKQLAEQFGFEIRDPKADDTSTTSTTAATNAGDEAVAELKEALSGVGLDELADKLAPVIRKIADKAAGAATEPLRTHQEKLIEESTQRETKATLDAFGKSHPDYKPGNAIDKAMAKLSKSLLPAEGMNELEYLDNLYVLATKDDMVKKAAQEAIDRMTKNAQTTDGKKASTVTGDKVSTGRPAGAGFRQAAEVARRGERWD